MKTIKFLTYSVFVLLLSISISSCKGDDGAVGPAGADGINGTDGADGTDGNANVQTYVYTNPSWNDSGWGLAINMEDVLTDEILENDVILTYAKFSGYDMISSLPGLAWTGQWRNYGVYIGDSVSSDPGVFTFSIVSFEMNGTPTPNANLAAIDWIKIIIIDSTNTTTTSGNGARPANTKQQILNELENAGVDINDYQAVCDYYGIDTE